MIKLNFTFALKNNPTWIHSKQPPHQKKEEDKFRNWVSNMFWPASTPSKQWIQRLLSPLWPPTSTSSSFNSVPPSFNCVAITKSQQWHLSVKMVYFAFYFLGQKYSLFGRYYGWWEWEWMTPPHHFTAFLWEKVTRCFSTSELFWHAKNHSVSFQKKWDLGRPPPSNGKIPTMSRFLNGDRP